MERIHGKAPSSKSSDTATPLLEETVIQPTAVDVPASTPTKGGKAKGGKGTRSKRAFCHGCQKFLDPNAMSNVNYGVACKKITDRIYACARAQGKTAWTSTQLSKPDSCVALIENYKHRCGDIEGFSKRSRGSSTKTLLMQYIECVEAEQGVLMDSIGIMMSLDAYIKHVQGKMTAEEAMHDFNAKFRDESVISDHKDGIKRIRVATEDKVTFRNGYFNRRRIEVKEKEQKKLQRRTLR
eukprot:6483295-Amphidinium_carterae.2